MFKTIVVLLLVILASAYAFGWFSDVGLGDKTTEEFNAGFIYQWKLFVYDDYLAARHCAKAVRDSISK